MSTNPNIRIIKKIHSASSSGLPNLENSEEGVLSLTQLISRQALRTPQALALKSGADELTYQELEQSSNQLAHHLVSLGVEPEVIVGVCLERSFASVIAATAVLKAGGAYLPLDPSYPQERLALLIRDAEPRVVISRNSLRGRLGEMPENTVAVDCDDDQISSCSKEAPANCSSPSDLAYVIYTSGSTGAPKGVEVTHENLANLIRWHQEAFTITANDRASLLASVGFDASVWETWPYLSAGASLHLPDDETRLNVKLLQDWLVSERISITFLPTVLAEELMSVDWPNNTSLRFLLTGADTLRRFPKPNLPFAVINNYGPTECTVVATSGVVKAGISREMLPTIGSPITSTYIYLLDDNLRQVTPGSAGELYIGGAGVARGYFKRPDLSAERFIQDPFLPISSARLYRTGDLGRRLPNGEIAYLGRADDQIKVMGYRIEPNEIVAVIDRHPEVQSSVVVARDLKTNEKQLAAYLVLREESQLSAQDLREFLRAQLPDYMVPSIFVCIDALPLTQNGKLDRNALPAPDAENTLWEQVFTAPSTPLEKRLAEMLSSLLGIDEVSVNDNFFLLGGHSLLGTQLIGQIRTVFGVDLALRALFDAPTIAELAWEVEELLRAKVEAMSEDEVVRLLG
jgi:amino acid adenylation domain-containing protein